MTKTLKAVFDGEVLRPIEPVHLAPNTKVRLTLVIDEPATAPQSFLQTARGLELDGPADWSENLDTYLYGQADNDG